MDCNTCVIWEKVLCLVQDIRGTSTIHAIQIARNQAELLSDNNAPSNRHMLHIALFCQKDKLNNQSFFKLAKKASMKVIFLLFKGTNDKSFKLYVSIILCFFIFQPIYSQSGHLVLLDTRPVLIKGVWNPILYVNNACQCDSMLLLPNSGLVMRDTGCVFRIKPATLDRLLYYPFFRPKIIHL